MAEEYAALAPVLMPYDGNVPEPPVVYPTYTYKLDLERKRIIGYTDGLDAIKQMVYKILDTVAGAHPIYSPGYGLFLLDLIGKDHDIAKAEIKRRVQENLLVDERIQAVSDFDFSIDGDILHMVFRVTATSGDVFEISREVRLS